MMYMLPVLILMMMMTAAGMGMLLSSMAIQYRDVKFALTFLIMIMNYAAPVVWPASKIPADYRMIYAIYPMGGVIDGFRAILLGGPMPWDLISIGALSSVVIFVLGAMYFRKMEKIFADVA
jgi:lipopolysaccharide transport system permease protein